MNPFQPADGYFYVPCEGPDPLWDAQHYCEGTNFQYQKQSKDGRWVLIYHRPTRQDKWVELRSLHVVGDISVAFYDADPTYLPESERPV